MLTLGIQHCGTKSSQKHLIHTGYSTLLFKKYPGTACSHREFNITVQKVARYSVFIPGIQHCGSKSIQVQRVHNGYSTLWFKKYPGTIFSHRVFNTAVQFQAARYNVFTSGIQHCGSKSSQVQRVHTGYSTLWFKSIQVQYFHTGYSTLLFNFKQPGTTCSHRVLNIAVQKVSRYSVFSPGIQHCGSSSRPLYVHCA